MQEFLTVDRLGDLDGGIARHLINDAISTAMKDLMERGERDGKPREVTIKLAFEFSGDQIITDVRAKATVPEYRSGITVGKGRMVPGKPNEVGFLFQPLNPEDPQQGTFADYEKEGR